MLLAIIFFDWQELKAQTPGPVPVRTSPVRTAPKPAPQPPLAQAAPAAPKAAPAAPSGPVRTEQIAYDSWTVVCRDTADGKTKKVCSATLPMQMEQQNKRVNLGAWVIGHNNEGAMLSVLQTPQIDIGVLIAKGVELKLGEAKPRKIDYVMCNPQRCESMMTMDDATIKEMVAAASVVLTIWKADGGEFTINIPSIKGIDKAIAAVR